MQDPVEKRLTLGEHLEELRARVVWSLLYVLGGLIACFAAVDPLMRVVIGPYKSAMKQLAAETNQPELAQRALIALRPAESFMNHLKVAFIGGLFIAGPFVLAQAWAFVAAGLYRNERRSVVRVLPVSIVLFLLGSAFGYFILVPAALNFLIGYGKEVVEVRLDVAEYLDFFFLLTLLTGVSFELPLVMTFFSRVGLVTAETYRKKWKVAVLLAFVLGGVLTPSPDPFTQCLLAGPLYLLYEGGILLSRWTGKKPAEATP